MKKEHVQLSDPDRTLYAGFSTPEQGFRACVASSKRTVEVRRSKASIMTKYTRSSKKRTETALEEDVVLRSDQQQFHYSNGAASLAVFSASESALARCLFR